MRRGDARAIVDLSSRGRTPVIATSIIAVLLLAVGIGLLRSDDGREHRRQLTQLPSSADVDGSQLAEAADPATPRTQPGRDGAAQSVQRLPSVIDGVDPSLLPEIEAVSPAAPSETGTLVVEGGSVFDVSPESRPAFAGRAIEGRDLLVVASGERGFWAGGPDDAVYSTYGDTAGLRLEAGDLISLRGLVRVAHDDFDISDMTGDERASLRVQGVYIHPFEIEVSTR